MEDNPIIKALPPETDYLTYLTIVEYNLTKERLPSLHTVLQSPDLTINIGWDLVHILLPLLPESHECLEDVAKLGNPREVILKVTELLEGIGCDDLDGNNDDSGEDAEELEGEDIPVEDGQTAISSDPTPSLSLNALKFQHLVAMLTTLHPRIKTKFPSRFLATSLQAILPAYIKTLQTSSSTATLLAFIRTIATSTRPRLPPRAGSTVSVDPEPAPDPEASVEPSGSEEAALQMRLLQSFLTYIIEAWMEGSEAVGQVRGLAWAARFWERSHEDRVLEGRMGVRKEFEESAVLKERDGIAKELTVRKLSNPKNLSRKTNSPKGSGSGAQNISQRNPARCHTPRSCSKGRPRRSPIVPIRDISISRRLPLFTHRAPLPTSTPARSPISVNLPENLQPI